MCVHSLYNSVHSVPTVRVCGVLAETKSGGLVPSQAENLKRKFNPVTHTEAWIKGPRKLNFKKIQNQCI